MDNSTEIKSDILDEARSKGLATPSAGMRVPDGYFEDFSRKMASQLPYRAEAENPSQLDAQTRRSWWAKVRPYVYMAAMFAGIWLMLQMFAMMGGQGKQLQPIESNPVMVAAFNDDDFMNDYLYSGMSNYELYDEIRAYDIEYENSGEPVEVYGLDSDTVIYDSMI